MAKNLFSVRVGTDAPNKIKKGMDLFMPFKGDEYNYDVIFECFNNVRFIVKVTCDDTCLDFINGVEGAWVHVSSVDECVYREVIE